MTSLPRAFSLVLLLTGLSGTVARAGESAIPVTPVPGWVSRLAIEPSSGKDGGGGGVIEELLDDQLRLGDDVERYRRRVTRLTTGVGVESSGQIQIQFDPLYEHLRVHGLAIVRDGQRIDALKRASIRVLEQEGSADELIYGGTLTALFVVSDLRVGDMLDLEYSLAGRNPVFGDRFVAGEPLSSRRGARRVRLRALLPPDRAIAFRTVGIDLAPREQRVDGVRELVWERRDVGAAPDEDRAPSWFDERAFVSFSEFPSWGEVARWAAPLFEEAAKPGPDVLSKANELAAGRSDPAARALAALRFVQDDVRYLGIEMGASSHRPHDAQSVLEQRFGDCKDKVVLFVALSRALGIEAEPVLVDTDLKAHLADRLPSPFAFDHVIARVRLGGRVFWVDPTRSLERGPLGGTPVTLGRGLVVDPSTMDLATIHAPAPAAPTILARESYLVDGANVSLDVTTTYRGEDADDLRQHVANTPREKLVADWLNYYAKSYHSIEAVGQPEFSDDTMADVFVVREHYAIKDPFAEGGLEVSASVVSPLVREPWARPLAPTSSPRGNGLGCSSRASLSGAVERGGS